MSASSIIPSSSSRKNHPRYGCLLGVSPLIEKLDRIAFRLGAHDAEITVPLTDRSRGS
jgi:hypothetical protein